MKSSWPLTIFTALLLPALVYGGDTEYYQHIIFDNSLTADDYFYSYGQASGGSSIEQRNGRLPVETNTFVTAPNALRLHWQSQATGGWEAEVRVVNFRYRYPELSGKNLYLWCYSPQAIAADDLPRIMTGPILILGWRARIFREMNGSPQRAQAASESWHW